jgi:hypothetical protein
MQIETTHSARTSAKRWATAAAFGFTVAAAGGLVALLCLAQPLAAASAPYLDLWTALVALAVGSAFGGFCLERRKVVLLPAQARRPVVDPVEARAVLEAIAANQPVEAARAERILRAADAAGRPLHVGTATSAVVFGGTAFMFLCAAVLLLPKTDGTTDLASAGMAAPFPDRPNLSAVHFRAIPAPPRYVDDPAWKGARFASAHTRTRRIVCAQDAQGVEHLFHAVNLPNILSPLDATVAPGLCAAAVEMAHNRANAEHSGDGRPFLGVQPTTHTPKAPNP